MAEAELETPNEECIEADNCDEIEPMTAIRLLEALRVAAESRSLDQVQVTPHTPSLNYPNPPLSNLSPTHHVARHSTTSHNQHLSTHHLTTSHLNLSLRPLTHLAPKYLTYYSPIVESVGCSV
jgi:hypothetical protein